MTDRRTLPNWVRGYGIESDPDALPGFDVIAPHLARAVRSVEWRVQRSAVVRLLTPHLNVTEYAVRLVVGASDIAAMGAMSIGPVCSDGDQAAFAYEAGDVLVSGVAAEQDGRLVVRSITIEPNPIDDGNVRNTLMPGGLSSSDLRSVSIPRILRQLRLEKRNADGWGEAMEGLVPVSWSSGAEVLKDLPTGAAQQVSRSNVRPDAFYRDVAVAYLEEQQTGRGLYRRLAQRYKHSPEATLRTWVKVAQERGFLTAGTRGRQDREPGPRLTETPSVHPQPKEQT